MAKDTRERILDAALEVFARNGYAGTNIKDIADAVGIVKSALYRHFDGKEAIWDAVRDGIGAYYEIQIGSPDRLPVIPRTTEELASFTIKTVLFTVNDKRVVQIRKILTTEQYRDEKTRDCANNYFLYRTEAMFQSIFKEMMKNGTIKKCDPGVLAFAYTTPITALIHLCDRTPDLKEEAMDRLQAFIRQFIGAYGVRPVEKPTEPELKDKFKE